MGQPPNVLARKCASRRYLALVPSKWSLLVINAPDYGPARNGHLMRKVERIWQKMLTQTLFDLVITGSSSVKIAAPSRPMLLMN